MTFVTPKNSHKKTNSQKIPALGRQTQADLCELEISLIYKANSRTARAAIPKKKKKKKD